MTYIKKEFEKKLKNLGFSYKCNTAEFYTLYKNKDTNSIINAQLIYSEPNEEVIQLSNNGNKIEAIGSFKLRLTPEHINHEFLILAFHNISKHSTEFIIVPSKELKRRLVEGDRISTDIQEMGIVFWLMPDRFLYDCTNLGVQGEWYYMSKGVNGRMADATEWDYSEFLNDWNRL